VELTLRNPTSAGNRAVPCRLTRSLRRTLTQNALAVSLWFGLILPSHAGWTFVPAEPVWFDGERCMAQPYAPDNLDWTPKDKKAIAIHCDAGDNYLLALRPIGILNIERQQTCGQVGDLTYVNMTGRDVSTGIIRVTRNEPRKGCALTYRCRAGDLPTSGAYGEFTSAPPTTDAPPLCYHSWTPDPSPPPAGGPGGGPTAGFYYIMLTDGTTFVDGEGMPSTIPQPMGTIEIEPAQRTAQLFAQVHHSNGAAVGNIEVELTVTASDKSAGHAHLDNRPKGELIAISPNTGSSGDSGTLRGKTSEDGSVLFRFEAPAVAGDHVITARCADRDCGEAQGQVWVGVKGLQPLSVSTVDKLVGKTDAHPDNHYLTLTAASRVTVLAAFYQAKYPDQAVLHLNDASLERGGVFDIYPATSPNWKSPHFEHCRGTVIDIRANGQDGALDITSDGDPMIKEIKKLGKIVGADPEWEVPQDKDHNRLWRKRHFHTKLMGQEGTQCP
jgi:hypothetical protein